MLGWQGLELKIKERTLIRSLFQTHYDYFELRHFLPPAICSVYGPQMYIKWVSKITFGGKGWQFYGISPWSPRCTLFIFHIFLAFGLGDMSQASICILKVSLGVNQWGRRVIPELGIEMSGSLVQDQCNETVEKVILSFWLCGSLTLLPEPTAAFSWAGYV
jgi:hypothetical protein